MDEVELGAAEIQTESGDLSITRGFDRKRERETLEYIRYLSRTLGTVLVILLGS